jgi:hypothetical protein
MHKNFDPRAWNLFAGVALLSAGCGGRIAGQEAGESGETAETNDSSETNDGPQCVTASDCPTGYGCYDGVCMYYPHHDGWLPYYDCDVDSECGAFEICRFGYCESFGPAPENCAEQGLALPQPVPIAVEGEVLALTFADLDGDGDDELVVATQTELWVYEAGVMLPISTPLQPGTIRDMVAGNFDAEPGEDVLLWVDDAFSMYSSNGDGSFAAPVTMMPPLGPVVGLLAAELDEQPLTDLIGWAAFGAFVIWDGEPLVLNDDQYQRGAVHEFGSPGATGFALQRGANLDLFGLDGALLTELNLEQGSIGLAALTRGSTAEYVSLVNLAGWSRVQPYSWSQSGEPWGVFGTPEQVFAGNLLGDGDDELLFFDGSSAALEIDPGGLADCWYQLALPARGKPVHAVFGDHDGDGNDELAIRTDAGEVVLFDG